MRTRHFPLVTAALAALALAASACGGDGSTNGEGGGDGDAIIVGEANFPESQIIGSMYAQVLGANGYSVDEQDAGTRERYIDALKAGEINLTVEYIGSLAEFLNGQVNGPDAPAEAPLASGDPEETYANLTDLLDQVGGLDVTSYAKDAADQNQFAVTQETAERYGLSKMSDLAKPDVAGQLILGAGADCETKAFCLSGLERVYGAEFKPDPAGAYHKFENPGDANTLDALEDGTIGIGLVFTSDGSVEEAGLVRLEDDKHLQPSDNICALSQRGALDDKARDLVDQVNQALTTDDLKELNSRFNVDKEDAEDIARDFLTEQGLLSQ